VLLLCCGLVLLQTNSGVIFGGCFEESSRVSRSLPSSCADRLGASAQGFGATLCCRPCRRSLVRLRPGLPLTWSFAPWKHLRGGGHDDDPSAEAMHSPPGMQTDEAEMRPSDHSHGVRAHEPSTSFSLEVTEELPRAADGNATLGQGDSASELESGQGETVWHEEPEEWSSGMGNPGSDTLWVPDNFTNMPRAIRKCCGVMLRYVEWPAPGADGLIDPPIDQFGEPVLTESHEWEDGTGQKLRLRGGYYTWGAWSERLKRFKYPNIIIVAAPLDMQGVEDGVCLNGGWTFLNGTGLIRHLALVSTHDFVAGMGGGMLMHIEGGDWKLERCRLQIKPGPLTCVMAVCGEARVAVNQSLISRMAGAEIGSLGYGMFVWHSASVHLSEVSVWELKVGADVSYTASLSMHGCNVSFNRIGVLMHDESSVAIQVLATPVIVCSPPCMPVFDTLIPTHAP
jgi:hypothetical protein